MTSPYKNLGSHWLRGADGKHDPALGEGCEEGRDSEVCRALNRSMLRNVSLVHGGLTLVPCETPPLTRIIRHILGLRSVLTLMTESLVHPHPARSM
jgi:hypothetical protein